MTYKSSSKVHVGQIAEKVIVSTFLHIVLKFQFDHVCFQAEEESANFCVKLE